MHTKDTSTKDNTSRIVMMMDEQDRIAEQRAAKPDFRHWRDRLAMKLEGRDYQQFQGVVWESDGQDNKSAFPRHRGGWTARSWRKRVERKMGGELESKENSASKKTSRTDIEVPVPESDSERDSPRITKGGWTANSYRQRIDRKMHGNVDTSEEGSRNRSTMMEGGDPEESGEEDEELSESEGDRDLQHKRGWTANSYRRHIDVKMGGETSEGRSRNRASSNDGGRRRRKRKRRHSTGTRRTSAHAEAHRRQSRTRSEQSEDTPEESRSRIEEFESTAGEEDQEYDDYEVQTPMRGGKQLFRENMLRSQARPVPGAFPMLDDSMHQETRDLGTRNSVARNEVTPIDVTTGEMTPSELPGSENIAVAVFVKSDEDQSVVIAEDYDPNRKKKIGFENPRARRYGIIGCVLLAVVALIVGLVIGLVPDRSNDTPTPSPTTALELMYLERLAETVGESVMSPGTPESRAADWLINEDSMQISIDDPNFVQRFVLALLYYSTTDNGRQPWSQCQPAPGTEDESCVYELTGSLRPLAASRWLSSKHECDWGGISCTENETVVELEMGKYE